MSTWIKMSKRRPTYGDAYHGIWVYMPHTLPDVPSLVFSIDCDVFKESEDNWTHWRKVGDGELPKIPEATK